MAKKQKGPVSPSIKVTADKPKPPKRRAPGFPKTLIAGNQHSEKNEHGCNDREARFVEYYTLSWNKGEAVRNAGYDCINTTSYANQLLDKPHIKALVDKARAEFREKTSDIRDQLTAALVESAFYDASKYIKLVQKTERGKTVIVPEFQTTDALENGAGRLISTIKIGRNHTVEIKLDNKEQARELLAKHIGYLEMDNLQKKSNDVAIYIPDNSRGDVVDSSDEKRE